MLYYNAFIIAFQSVILLFKIAKDMYLYFENNVEEQRDLLKLNNEVIEDNSTDFMK